MLLNFALQAVFSAVGRLMLYVAESDLSGDLFDLMMNWLKFG